METDPLALQPKETNPLVLGIDATADAIIKSNRVVLARSITLIESTRESHQDFAQKLLQTLMPQTGQSVRIGISGVPGVGKSTFIESFGMFLLDQGHKVAVLAVDPTSARTGGSILGDKTRMANLSMAQNAFIRPSPTGGTLGGVASKTREAMLLCEAAGFNVILVETVGVGQSEHLVSGMVDFFLVLMLARSGDELQGIKRGIIELADALVINKSDSEDPLLVRRTKLDYENALMLVHGVSEQSAKGTWVPQVLSASGLNGQGLFEIWNMICQKQKSLSPQFRSDQQVDWFWTLVEHGLLQSLAHDENVTHLRQSLEPLIRSGLVTPMAAARDILKKFLSI